MNYKCTHQFVDKFGKYHKYGTYVTDYYYKSLPNKDKKYFDDRRGTGQKPKKKDDEDDGIGYSFSTNPFGGSGGSDW